MARVSGAAVGWAIGGAAASGAAARGFEAVQSRREVVVGGRRIRTVDVHAHCMVPAVREAITRLKDTQLAATLLAEVDRPALFLQPQRLHDMNRQGIDVQALSINAFWYAAPRELAAEIVQIQNETMARWCSAHPDRFVGLASVALQYPDLAADQLEHGVRKLGMRGVAIGGSIPGEELAARRFDPFWAKAEELGTLVFMHPQTASGTTDNPRLLGKGRLDNLIGNPLETTVFLSHLIFEGTLDRFPGLRICASHGAGFFGSYSRRSDALCARASGVDCRSLKKRPSAYLNTEIFADTIVFHGNGLRHLVGEMGVGQVMYGTDYPFDWPVGIDVVLNAPFLSAADQEAILGGTAARLLRLS